MGPFEHTASARAVYEATSAEYVRLVGSEISGTTETSEDRSLLEDLLRDARSGPLADLGSGPGRVAAMCREQGVDSVAVDMAVAMLRVGRDVHGEVPFVAAYLSSLPFRSATFSATVLWYSIIHTSPADLGPLFAEVRRVTGSGAPVLVAFQAGDGAAQQRIDAYGTAVTMTTWHHQPSDVVASLRVSGFSRPEVTVRPPALAHETARQAFVRATASR